MIVTETRTATSSAPSTPVPPGLLPTIPKRRTDANGLRAEEDITKLVDMNAPLVWQVLSLNKEQYLKWVHTPQRLDRVARLFQSSWLEPLSRTVWWVVPLFWLPIVAAMLWMCVLTYSWQTCAAAFTFGLCFWTLLEYLLHRFVFHVDELLPDNGIVLMCHFLLHGVHHLIPMDPLRLVMPPALAVLIAIPVVCVLRPVLPVDDSMFAGVFAGTIFGYVFYDLTHYMTHHVPAGWTWIKYTHIPTMAKYHMRHHFHNLYHQGYGLTSKFWDWVFGTMIQMPQPAKRA